MYFDTNLAHANSYYLVTAPFDVFVDTGRWLPTNCWYGSSRISRPEYQPLTLQPGYVLLNLIGGLFYAEHPGAVCRPIALALNEKSPFEKRYGGLDHHVYPLDKLTRIVDVTYVHATEPLTTAGAPVARTKGRTR